MGEDMSIFDNIYDRSGTYSVKYEERKSKFGKEDVLPLWVADMDLPSPECVVSSLKKRASHPIYGYTIYPDRFFEAIIGWMYQQHNWSIKREHITPIPGVVPALNFLVTALSKPGDAILIQTPVYHPFFRLAKNHKRVLLENPLHYEDGRYTIDFDDFREKAKEAKLFIFCSPHNPVGRVWKEEELSKMAQICLEENCLIISDEIHADIVYKPNRHIPTASISSEIANITITLNAPSKTFNIAGSNTAYAIISNDSIRRHFEIELRKYDMTIGNLFGIEALISAYEGGKEWLNELLKYLQGNINYVTTFLQNEIGLIHPVKSESTYLMWLDCKNMDMNDEELEKFFIEKAKLGLNRGVTFGKEGNGFMRLNIGCPRTTLQKAMEQLKSAF